MAVEPPDLRAGKVAWRRWARELPAPDPAAEAAVHTALDGFLSTVEGTVLGYLALPDEVDITPLLTARPLGALALPRLDEEGTMTLHVDDGDRERHAFGVDQPAARAPLVAPHDLAAVVVPGRIFDRRGYRLGRGGGHYDRLLTIVAAGTPIIGVTTLARLVDAVPTEPHDRPMTHLATEDGMIAARQ